MRHPGARSRFRPRRRPAGKKKAHWINGAYEKEARHGIIARMAHTFENRKLQRAAQIRLDPKRRERALFLMKAQRGGRVRRRGWSDSSVQIIDRPARSLSDFPVGRSSRSWPLGAARAGGGPSICWCERFPVVAQFSTPVGVM